MSNAACDVIASRLLKLIPEILVYRMYSFTAKTQSSPVEVRISSNVADGDAYYPCLENLSLARVLVCTLTVAGRLAQANISLKQPHHFSYLFIDECASATEPTAMIPIAG